jgi:hypothetical protein
MSYGHTIFDTLVVEVQEAETKPRRHKKLAFDELWERGSGGATILL